MADSETRVIDALVEQLQTEFGHRLAYDERVSVNVWDGIKFYLMEFTPEDCPDWVMYSINIQPIDGIDSLTIYATGFGLAYTYRPANTHDLAKKVDAWLRSTWTTHRTELLNTPREQYLAERMWERSPHEVA